MRYGIVVDKDGETSRAYGITALPTMMLVDKKGVVREVFIGFDPQARARVEALTEDAPRRAAVRRLAGRADAVRPPPDAR